VVCSGTKTDKHGLDYATQRRRDVSCGTDGQTDPMNKPCGPRSTFSPSLVRLRRRVENYLTPRSSVGRPFIVTYLL